MKVKVHEMDVSNSIVDMSVTLGSGESQSSCTIRLLDSDDKIRDYLTERTIEIKGIVGVPKPKPAPVIIGALTGTVASPGTPLTGNANIPGFTVGAGGVPSYPVPQDVKSRVLGIVRECLRQGVTDIAQIAYVLGTVRGEVGLGGYGGGLPGGYGPVTEVGGPFRYDPWRGRGLIQVTWIGNYQKVKAASGRDVIGNPNLLVTDFGLSAWALVWGMKGGIYTGKKLSDYINGSSRDFIGARRIVNGTDKASLFAGYANQWLRDLPPYIASAQGSQPVSARPQAPPTPTAPTTRTAPVTPPRPPVTPVTPRPPVTPVTPTTPTTPATPAVPVVPAAPAAPEAIPDKVEIEVDGEEWEFVYGGLDVGLEGVLTVTGIGARKVADSAVTLPRTITNSSVNDVADAVGGIAKKPVVKTGVTPPKKEEIVVGSLTPTQLLAREASRAGKTVSDNGKVITVKDKPGVTPKPVIAPPRPITGTTPVTPPVSPTSTYAADDLISFNLSDKPVGDLTIISGNNVKGFPSDVSILLATGIKAGDGFSSPLLTPKDRVWTIDKVTHEFLANVTNLSIYSEFEANSSLIIVAPPPIQMASPTGVPVSGAVTAVNPNAGAAIAGATGKLGKMLAAGLAARGLSSASGPSGGRLACAWAVNRWVLVPALGKSYGTNTNLVTSLYEAMKREGWADVPAGQAPPGCICSAWNATGGHVGLIIRSGPDPMSLSNSSSRASFVSEYPWVSQMSRTYRGCEFHFMVPN